ncbi:MAG: RNA degradosome polyphosphate kinase [Pseudomonadota bacterium]|nr:RNA degradosome polyphosphate kinase [Pseudomonadota bacterium]
MRRLNKGIKANTYTKKMVNDTKLFNRELSTLAFNYRVLEESFNEKVPLMERLNFLSISSSNLDEFYMIRVAGIKEQIRSGKGKDLTDDGLTLIEQDQLIRESVESFLDLQNSCWFDIRDKLNEEQINIICIHDLLCDENFYLESYFKDKVLPILTPLAIDNNNSFPFIPNLGLSKVIELYSENQKKTMDALIPIPQSLPRFVKISNNEERYLPIEDMIEMFASYLFPGFKILNSGLFRLIRDSEMEIDDDKDDLLQSFESALRKRRRGICISLTFSSSTSKKHIKKISKYLQVSSENIFISQGLIGLRDIQILNKSFRKNLMYKPFLPRFPERVRDFDGDYFSAIKQKDILVHHPYETFDSVLQFLRQASRDSNVMSIKQTIYRAGKETSPVMSELIEAAERGKSVTAMIELKARFDEEANIRWARDLEDAGGNVVFGYSGLKTHAKICLVTRREGTGLKSYAHFGTGNYHPINAKIYTDLSLFTADQVLCRDANKVFNFMTGYAKPESLEKLTIAPLSLRDSLEELIENEIQFAKNGYPANIWAKMNALVDPQIINKLYLASQSGVSIYLVVRGACCLRPGVIGLSENIIVKSLVGRFLEHSRVFAFGNGYSLPSGNARVFISSADWMPRNFKGRIETLVPIENPTVHSQILEQVMVATINDNKQSWLLNSDGTYSRIETDKNIFSAHDYFMKYPSLSGQGTALKLVKVLTPHLKPN